jgi:hypothetical protein
LTNDDLLKLKAFFTAEPQSAQRIFIHLKGKQLLMDDGLKLARDAIARRACGFNFLPFLSASLFGGSAER